MACVSPLTILVKKQWRTVPCGQCAFCLEKKRNEWSIRIQKELRYSDSAYFLTLTYDEENVPWADDKQTLCKRDHTLFMKRLRKRQEYIDLRADDIWNNFKRKNEKRIRFFMVAEYGPETNRPHFHYILFNVEEATLQKVKEVWNKCEQVKVGKLTPSRIHYATKYCITNHKEYTDIEKPFNSMSTNPGIGYSYIEDNYEFHRKGQNFFVRDLNGYKHAMPRFYRDKIFGRIELEKQKIKSQNYADRRNEQIDRIMKKNNPDSNIEKLKVEMKQSAIEKKTSFQTKNQKL